MSNKKFLGKLIAIDMYNCTGELLEQQNEVKDLLEAGCAKFSLGLQQCLITSVEGAAEYSVTALCQQGHVALHVYPTMGFMTADICTCLEDADPAGLGRYLRNVLEADRAKITLVDRGDFGTASDMKPKRRSNVKFIRRTKNLGGKLKQLLRFKKK